MTNRREFLRATALAAAVPIVARSGGMGACTPKV